MLHHDRNGELTMTSSTSSAAIPALQLESAEGACARISPHGAHLLSWIPKCGGERLYLSSKAQAGAGQTIRGGVPVIFPQFAFEGPLPKHGFVRAMPWTRIAHGRRDDGAGYARFVLRDDDATRALWPHAFSADMDTAVIGDTLAATLTIRNTGSAPFTFTAALHSYLRVADVGTVSVHGLQGLRYRDKVLDNAACVEQHAALNIVDEVDRIYFNAPSSTELHDGARRLKIRHENFPDTVVWNPGPELAASLHDLDDGGWRQMLCIEAAVIGTPVTLTPGKLWRAAQILEAA